MNRIKKYFEKLKIEHKKEHENIFLKDYEKAVPYLRKFEKFLVNMLSEKPMDVNAVCTLASVKNELGYEQFAIDLLEKFLLEYEEFLCNEDKARIFMNIGFYYYEHEGKGKKYLLKAEELNSPFVETYKVLAMYFLTIIKNTKMKRI